MPLFVVSIHAPAWGATRLGLRGRAVHRRFNPRARVGRDVGVGVVVPRYRFQSTRPAWGATTRSRSHRPPGCFNPRAPRGARHCGCALSVQRVDVSIHAPRVGRDQTELWCLCPPIRFNPRARVGRDARHGNSNDRSSAVSIHAPAWGATWAIGIATAASCFNPRARVGRDETGATRRPSRDCFNPRARVGRDAITGNLKRSLSFQSTRPRGARRRSVPSQS